MNRPDGTHSKPMRIAMIGCGAVTKSAHLPAAALVREVEIAALVDTNLERARMLGRQFGIRTCLQDYRDIPQDIDGAVIALPNVLHAPVARALLARRLPVLVEKPMAMTSDEGRAMVAAAEEADVPLQVGLMYRFCSGPRLAKQAIEEGWLGTIQGFTLESGLVYDWPVASGFTLQKSQSGGGVLTDLGSHMLDLLLWWFRDAKVVTYRDDARGGVEADCQLALTLRGATGPVSGTVTLSRLRALRDTVRIIGDRCVLECSLSEPDAVHVRLHGAAGDTHPFVSDGTAMPRQTWEEVYAEQLRAFAHTVTTGAPPAVPGKDTVASLMLIERCYQVREPLNYPWETLPQQAAALQ